jgi:hypothetical protein
MFAAPSSTNARRPLPIGYANNRPAQLRRGFNFWFCTMTKAARVSNELLKLFFLVQSNVNEEWHSLLAQA